MIEQLRFKSSEINIEDFNKSYPLHHGIKSLEFCGCRLEESDVIQLSEVISHMTILEALVISHNQCREDGLLKVLQQLSQSNVTRLDITYTGYCDLLHLAEFYLALKRLIDPSAGKLEELCVGDIEYDIQLLINLISPLSSLKTLKFCLPNNTPSFSGLEANTCLTKLEIQFVGAMSQYCNSVVEILESNKTIQQFTFSYFEVPEHIDIL